MSTKKIGANERAQLQPGDIVVAPLDPVMGSETAKRRPLIVVSAQALNAVSRTVTVVPLTSGKGAIMRLFPYLESSQTDCGKQGSAAITQMTSLDLVARDAELVGSVIDPDFMDKLKLRMAAMFEITLDTLDR